MVLAADVDLGLGPEPLDRVGEHVLGAVADELAGLRALDGEEAERAAARERLAQVDLLAVELGADRVLGQARSDRRRATSSGVVPGGTVRTEPSGRVRWIASSWSIGASSKVRSKRDAGAEARRAGGSRAEGLVGASGLEPLTSTV